MKRRPKAKTVEKVRAMLATLKPNPLRGKNAVRPEAIAAYCAKAGRSFLDPAKLAEKLRKWVG
jgi:hypothetical protein